MQDINDAAEVARRIYTSVPQRYQARYFRRSLLVSIVALPRIYNNTTPHPLRIQHPLPRQTKAGYKWPAFLFTFCSQVIGKIKELFQKYLGVFYTLTEAKVLIDQWRREYNQVRPHSSLGYRPPAPEARIPITLA